MYRQYYLMQGFNAGIAVLLNAVLFNAGIAQIELASIQRWMGTVGKANERKLCRNN